MKDLRLLKWHWTIMLPLCAIYAACSGASSTASKITETEHGWRTDRVIATRYASPVMGQNIGFRFPEDPSNCDRAEISDLVAGFGGSIFQGGGFPGAESYVVFAGVNNRATADAKIKAILPELTLLMQSLDDKKAVAAILARHPIPKHKCKEGESGGVEWPGGVYNGRYYSEFSMVCRDGKFVVDEQQSALLTKMLDDNRRANDELIWAARTRILSDGEMNRLRSLGPRVFVTTGQVYRQEDLDRQFNDLMLQQFRMREIISAGASSTHH